MTTPQHTDSPTSTGPSTQETAKQETEHVADVARSEAGHVADEAMEQARGLLEDVRTELDAQSRGQRDRLVDTLRTFSDDLEQMASQGDRPGMAQDLLRQVAGRARDLTSGIDGREPSELLDEVRNFARRRPGTFLLGAAAAGVVAGRMTRGAKQARDAGRGQQQAPGTATAQPVAGVGPAADEALDPQIGAPAGAPPAAGTPPRPGPVPPQARPPADEPWIDDPTRRGAL